MAADSKRKAGIGLGLFLLLVSATSVFFGLKAETLRSLVGAHAIGVYIWSVAGASMIVRLLLREPLHDVSFRWNGWRTTRATLVGISMPLLVGITSCGLGWALGLAGFAPAHLPMRIYRITVTGSDTARFWKQLLISLTVGGLWISKSAAGEEIGWRGYMLTRLIKSGVPAPLFLSGLIWAMWHLPLILTREYAPVSPAPGSIALFAIDIIGLGYVMAWLRLSSGSIWPCIWAHGVWNATIVGVFRDATNGGNAWVGEAGALTAIAVFLYAAALHWLWPMSPTRQSHQEPAPDRGNTQN